MRESVFTNFYKNLGAKFIDFHGYFCPLYFRGIFQEVLDVRNNVGIFDLFHMGRIFIYKNNNLKNLQSILSLKIESIREYKNKGKARYALILNEKGTIEDDVVIYDYYDKFFMVCNAANKEKNMNLFKELSLDFSDVSDDLLMIAVQGPKSALLVQKFFNKDLSDLYFYEYIIEDDFIISRSGYSGEDGFEIYSRPNILEEFLMWVIKENGNVMCGLGARDTLRIEVGLPLYGNEIDDRTTPLEANLMWAVNVERSFTKNKELRYFEVVNSKKIPRKGNEVFHNDVSIGYVTSGTFSPVLNKPIGMLYITRPVDFVRVGEIELSLSTKPLLKANYYKRLK